MTEELTKEEIERRARETARRMLTTPPKPKSSKSSLVKETAKDVHRDLQRRPKRHHESH